MHQKCLDQKNNRVCQISAIHCEIKKRYVSLPPVRYKLHIISIWLGLVCNDILVRRQYIRLREHCSIQNGYDSAIQHKMLISPSKRSHMFIWVIFTLKFMSITNAIPHTWQRVVAHRVLSMLVKFGTA